MVIPLERSEQLIKEINAMIYAPRDESAIMAIEAQLPSIERVSYSKAKQIEGMIAGLRGDTAHVRSKFNAALCSSGNDFFILVNFAQALSNLHCMAEAVEYVDQAISYSQDDVELLIKAMEIHLNAYDTKGFEFYLERVNALGMSERAEKFDLNFSLDIKDKMEHLDVSWMQISERLEKAAEAIFSLGMSSPGFSRTLTDTGVLMEFDVFGSLDDAILAERAIQSRIADLPYSPADKFIAFSCAPV